MEQQPKKLVKIPRTRREAIVISLIDAIFFIGSAFMVYKIYHETGIYTSIVATTLLARTWFKKEVMKISYFMMRTITKQPKI